MKRKYDAEDKKWQEMRAKVRDARKRLMTKKSEELTRLAREVGIESLILEPVDDVFVINEPPFSYQNVVFVFKNGRRFTISATPSVNHLRPYLIDDWQDRRAFSVDMRRAYNEWQSLVDAALPVAEKNQKEWDKRIERRTTELEKDPKFAERIRKNRESWDKFCSSNF